MADLWEHEEVITSYWEDADIPAWIDQDISPYDVASILQGGCASGAYMPAVTYHQALKTMQEHGDDVLQYIEDSAGELPDVSGQGWSQMACTYLSTAVELWASAIENELDSALDAWEDSQEPEEPEEPEETEETP